MSEFPDLEEAKIDQFCKMFYKNLAQKPNSFMRRFRLFLGQCAASWQSYVQWLCKSGVRQAKLKIKMKLNYLEMWLPGIEGPMLLDTSARLSSSQLCTALMACQSYTVFCTYFIFSNCPPNKNEGNAPATDGQKNLYDLFYNLFCTVLLFKQRWAVKVIQRLMRLRIANTSWQMRGF